MNIFLNNCREKLEALDIYMEKPGGSELFDSKLSEIMTHNGWCYSSFDDTLIIFVDEGTEIPDLSQFGDVVNNGY